MRLIIVALRPQMRENRTYKILKRFWRVGMGQNNYPEVVGEIETVREILAGKSIARYGDGEFKIITGGDCVSQVYDKNLRNEMMSVLKSKHKDCLVGIPNMTDDCPKRKNWQPRAGGYAKFLREGKTYHSSFITRPDSAPWVLTEKYFDDLESLWEDRPITLVSCLERSLTPSLMTSAGHIDVVLCPRRDAYAVIDQLEEDVMRLGNERVILCAGPTATCLAHRLSMHGHHALDLGHIGMYWRRKAA